MQNASLQVSPLGSTLSTRRRRRQVHGRRRRRSITRRRRRGRHRIGILLDERVEPASETRRRTAGGRGRQARRSTAHAGRSTRSAVTAIAWVTAISARSGHGLVPGSGARGRRRTATAVRVVATTRVVVVASITAIRAAVTAVPIAVAATIAATVATVTSPGRRTAGRSAGRTTRMAAIVIAVVPRTPRSRTAGGTASPGPRITTAAAAAGVTVARTVGSRAGFDACGSGASAAEFLHELL